MTEERRIEDRRAAEVQALPVESPESVDVLDTLQKHVSDSLFAQLSARVELGVKKYGMRLKTHNTRDAFLDCKQEGLDGIMYGQQLFLQGEDDGRIRDRFIRLVLLIDEVQGSRKRTEPAAHGSKESNAGEQTSN